MDSPWYEETMGATGAALPDNNGGSLDFPADGRDIIVLGASAGGVKALRTIASTLPRDLPAAVLVVLHLRHDLPSQLPRILAHAGALPAGAALDGEPIEHGRIYVAPPDHHLLVEPGRVRLGRGGSERWRPAIDPLFASAAAAYGARVTGVLLTGYMDDGAAGLAAIKAAGGCTVVQHPVDAFAPPMPLSALGTGRIDFCLPLVAIPPLLSWLCRVSPICR